MGKCGRFPDRLDLRLLPRRGRWLVVRLLWRRGGWSRGLALLVALTWWRKDRRRFRLLSEFRYVTSTWITIRVERGTIVDFASVPCVCWRLIGQPVGEYAEASVVHDAMWAIIVKHLRRGGPCTFEWTNWVFRDGMRALGVARWRRWAMWWAVALNGQWQRWRISRQVAQARRRRP